jgi:hypothetical protein
MSNMKENTTYSTARMPTRVNDKNPQKRLGRRCCKFILLVSEVDSEALTRAP